MSTQWLVIRSVLTLGLLASMAWGVREVVAKRPMGSSTIWMCGIGLWAQMAAFAFHFFDLHSIEQLNEIHKLVQGAVTGIVGTALMMPILYTIRPISTNEVAQPPSSRGRRLLRNSWYSLAILPFSIALALMMLVQEELFVPMAVLCLMAIPNVVAWLRASQYLETLRTQEYSEDRPFARWAYGISAVSSLVAIFCALLAIISLGLQQRWIDAQ